MYIHMHGHCSVAMDTMYRVCLATDGVRGGVHLRDPQANRENTVL